MTTPLWCLVIITFLPIPLAVFGAVQRQKQFGVADNSNYRSSQVPKLEGLGARAYAAQANAWEAVAMFTVAVVVAHLAGAEPQKSSLAAMVFVGARVLHAAFYLADLDKLRSAIFGVGTLSCVYLIVLAAQA